MSSCRSQILSAGALLVCLLSLGAATPSCTDLVDLSPFPCASDGSCPIDLSCSAGQCVKFCAATIDCPEGRICSAGACLDSCETDDDCREGLLCLGGACVPSSTGAVCGNLSCEAGETCDSCPGDCPTCASCGNFSCEGGEDCASCANDCGACAQTCGDAFCDSAVFEDCASCPNDCGACQQGCNFFTGRCGFPQTCTLNEVNAAVCQPTGNVPIGQQCFGGDCGVDAACWGISPNFFCRQLCDDFHACPVGFCTPLGGLPSNAGVCESF